MYLHLYCESFVVHPATHSGSIYLSLSLYIYFCESRRAPSGLWICCSTQHSLDIPSTHPQHTWSNLSFQATDETSFPELGGDVAAVV